LGGTALSVSLLAAATGAYADDDVLETVVVTGTLFNPDVAPAKSSPDTTEPQTIIGKSYIEDSISPTADFVTILAITPSLTGMDLNGPGLSEGNVKNTLRGIPDGNFGMTFDGIPFGDTNGPTHHSSSYFPASTIGSIEVERGPGNAGNIGPSTYGGSINMYSEGLADFTRLKGSVSYGSFNTLHENLNIQSGNFPYFDNTHVLFNFDNTTTDGALTQQGLTRSNELLKIETQVAPNWTLTLFGNYGKLHEDLNDNNGATPAQVSVYGKNFALQNDNPALSTYVPYNVTDKWTDMDYVRLRGNLTDAVKIDNQAYTYAYVNETFSARNITQTIADINANTAEGQGGKNSPIVNGVKKTSDVPGYSKLNAYRVWGDVFRLYDDYQLGSVTGQVRAGVWWEAASTQRARLDYDMTACIANNINPWYQDGSSCQDSSLAATGKAVLTAGHGNTRYNGYAELLEHSSWHQYEPFLELEIKPLEGLTVTPGVKYIDWTHSTRSAVEPKLLKPYSGEFKTTRTLPFLEANYKIRPSWSVYAQYAQGIYVPDITAFEQKTTVETFPKAQTTTNYQVGTVFYADNFTVDGDVYYIPVKNNIVFENCNLVGGLSGDTCAVNTGQALYKGVEGEATYAFGDDIMNGRLRGLAVFINGSINSSRSNGLWLKQAPLWTTAGGLIYKHEGVKLSIIDKMVGPQWSDTANNPNYKVHTYNNMDVTLGYDFGQFELSLGIYNAFDSRSILAITENDSSFVANRLMSTDQYFFMPPRSYMLTLKASLGS